MTHRYALNYDWSKIGPVPWDERSIVTLQVDLWSYDAAPQLELAVQGWWGSFESYVHEGNEIAYEGGCEFLPVVVNDGRSTVWIVSHGEDAFDSIAHYAGWLHDVAVRVDPAATIVWTELPHQRPDGPRWPVDTSME